MANGIGSLAIGTYKGTAHFSIRVTNMIIVISTGPVILHTKMVNFGLWMGKKQ
jgi:hypothetical protein